MPNKFNRVHTTPGISDHEGVFAEVDINPIRPKQKRRNIPLYRKADWDSLKHHMADIHQQITKKTNSCSTDELWCIFRDGLQEGIRRFIPHKTAKSKDNFPWITADIRKMMRKRDKLYSRQKSSRTAENISQFKSLKHRVQREVRSAYWNYVESIIEPMDEEKPYEGMKRFWTLMKHARSDSGGIAPLRDQGQLVSDARGKAEILNRQFESVFTKDQTATQDVPSPSSPFLTAPDIHITSEGVLKLLSNLKPHKAAGPDQISPRIMKEMAVTLAPTLTTIFQKSLQTGEVPKDWRTADVAPIYKKGQKYVAANYRPVSLTCISSKVMEHIVTSHIMKHANTNNILSDFQHGFRENRSCETQLLQFVTDVVNNLHSGRQTDVLVMDFSKAFDKVSHTKLTQKLDFYGIRGKTNRWIEGFLRNRTQAVVVEGEKSDYVSVLSGVPQGSVLGPSLFLFYINDISEGLNSTVRLFADDTIAYLAIKSKRDSRLLQDDLNRLADWETKWQMEFHPDKCEVININHKKTTIKSDYVLHGHTLKSVDAAKYLGVTITKDLKWNTHIENAKTKANRVLGFLRRNLKINSEELKSKAYKTLVRPMVEYSATIWDPYTKDNINKIEMVQRRAARFVTNRWDRTDSVTDMISVLGWETLEQRRRDMRLVLMYKIANGLVAVPASPHLRPITRSSRLCHPAGYLVPSSTSDYHKFSFFPGTIREWNALLPDVPISQTPEAFKASLKSLSTT